MQISGKYNTATVFAKELDPATQEQIESMMNNPAFEGMKVAIQADCHAGAGSVIGFTAKLVDKVIPNLVGVDIGCGVLALQFPVKYGLSLERLDHIIHQAIPSGFKSHNSPGDNTPFITADEQQELLATRRLLIAKIKDDRYLSSVGTLGGGKHFIEVDQTPSGMWLVIHSGSRNFGLQVANYHQRAAAEKHPGFKNQEWLDMDDGGRDYLADMYGAQSYAAINRRVMGRIIAHHLGIEFERQVESVHNFIDPNDDIIRKGAISARMGQDVVIPMNMAFGTVFGTGRGSSDHNNSAPHGAGRVMSRGEARREIPMHAYHYAMKGVYSTTVCEATLDEAPMAYKDPGAILEALVPTVLVQSIGKPIYNFKDASKAVPHA